MIKEICKYLKNLIEGGHADSPQGSERTPFTNKWMMFEAPGDTTYTLDYSLEKNRDGFKSIDLYGTPLVVDVCEHPSKTIELGDLTPIKENVYYIVKTNERGVHFELNLTTI